MKKVYMLLNVAMLLLSGSGGYAQIMPATPTASLVTPTSGVNFLNSAFSACYTGGVVGADVAGVAWDDGAGNAYFAIADLYGGGWLPPITIVPPPGYTAVSRPDISIGGPGTPNTQYNWIAVSYIATAQSGGPNDLFMDVYFIHSPLNPPFAALFGPPTIGVPITTSGKVIASKMATPHLDVITGDGVGMYLGTAFGETFTLCWQEMVGGVPCVRAMHDWYRCVWDYPLTLSLCMVTWSPALGSANGYQDPDIAGIQRMNGTSLDFMGLLTYTDFSGNLFYQEWNVTTNSFGPPLSVDKNSRTPRIDAIDPYTANALSTPEAHYNIAYDNYTAPGQRIKVFNDAAGSYPINSFAVTTLWPAVAFGPDDTYTPVYDMFNLPADDVLGQQVDRYTGGLLTPGVYHAVDETGLETNTMPSISQEAGMLATPGNRVFVCWADVSGNIWWKTTGNPISFKRAPQTKNGIATNTNIHGAWSVMPNPAKNLLKLATDDDAAGDSYQVTDILGLVKMTDKIAGTDNHIDISALTPGMYLLKVFNADNNTQTIRFVKQ